jgi:uncharacterized protein YneF (UPF0154 family)
MENPQMAMPAEMAAQGPSPEEMAIYDQMRQQISPQEFSNEMLASASQVDPQAVAEFTQELQGLDVSPEELDALNDLVDQILANPEQYDQLRQQFLAQGMPDDILPEQFDPFFFAALNMAVDQLIAAPAGVQAFAEGGIAELKPIAKAIASYGRNGDTMLAHITPAEARMLKRRGGSGTINPATGLPEFFLKKAFKSIGRAVKKFAQSSIGRIVLPIALGFFLGPAAASVMGVGAGTAAGFAVSGFVGGAGSTLLAGGNLKDALRAGAIGGVVAGAGAALSGAQLTGAATMTPGQALQSRVDQFTGMFKPGASVQASVPQGGGAPEGLGPNQAPVPAQGDVVPKRIGTDYVSSQAPGPISPGPGYNPTRMAAASPGDFGAVPGDFSAVTSTPFKAPTIGESFSKMGEGLGMGDASANFGTFKEGATNLFSPGPTNAQITARAQEIMRTTPGSSLKDAMAAAAKEMSPGFLRTYGPAALAGTGIMALSGGFDTKPVQGGPMTQSLMKPVTQRIREGGTQRQMYMQGLPGVVYDEFGAPVFGQSSRLPTYDVPDYNFGGFNTPGMGGQGGIELPPVYIPPPGSFGSRQVAQPYNTASMYTNLVPRGYEDGGEVAAPPPAAATTTTPKKTPEQIAAERQTALETMISQQRAGRDIANQNRALRRAGGSGAMYANINAGLAALAPENNPMDLSDTGFGARNRAAQLAALNQTYAPMLQGQRNAMAEQARILGTAPGQVGLPSSTDTGFPTTTMPGTTMPGTFPGVMQPPVVRPPVVPPVVRPPVVPPVVRPTYSAQNIRDYLSTRPNMTDAEIRAQMDQFGITTAQMAEATGLPIEQVQQRYNAPSNFSNQAIQTYLADRPGLTDAQIRSAMNEFKVTPAQVAAATGVPFEQVQSRYDYAGSPVPTTSDKFLSVAAPAPRGGFTNQQVTDFLAANPNMSDAQIRTAMDLHGVGVGQMAAATGLPMDQVQSRYNSAFAAFDNKQPVRAMNMGGIAGLAQGGYPRRTGQISGPGTEKSDSIPAMLSDGEFVMTAKAVRGAGKGSRRAGAKQMYKLMHQLEKNAERG